MRAIATVALLLLVAVTAAAVTPDFDWSPNTNIRHGQTVQFFDRSHPEEEIAERRWTFTNYICDGGPNSGDRKMVHTVKYGRNPTFTFYGEGGHSVRLELLNHAGGEHMGGEKRVSIYVSAPSPTAGFSWTPTNPEPGELVTFSDESTSQNGGPPWCKSRYIISGQEVYGHDITHRFTAPGVYTVKHVIYDGAYLSDLVIKQVVVGEPPCSGNSPPTQPTNATGQLTDDDFDDRGDGWWIFPSLAWRSSDAENDNLLYDVYFGTSASPPMAISNLDYYGWHPTPPLLDYSTTYYWRVVARDHCNPVGSTSDVFSFTTPARDPCEFDRSSPSVVIESRSVSCSCTSRERCGNARFHWRGSDDCTPSGEIEYQHRLVGHSNAWTSWESDTATTYSQFDDGTYTFEVIARDAAGKLSPVARQRIDINCYEQQVNQPDARNSDGNPPVSSTPPATGSGGPYQLVVQVSPPSTGILDMTGGRSTYQHGSIVTLSIDPIEGYQLDHWSGGVESPSQLETQVIMTSDLHVTAHLVLEGGSAIPSQQPPIPASRQPLSGEPNEAQATSDAARLLEIVNDRDRLAVDAIYSFQGWWTYVDVHGTLAAGYLQQLDAEQGGLLGRAAMLISGGIQSITEALDEAAASVIDWLSGASDAVHFTAQQARDAKDAVFDCIIYDVVGSTGLALPDEVVADLRQRYEASIGSLVTDLSTDMEEEIDKKFEEFGNEILLYNPRSSTDKAISVLTANVPNYITAFKGALLYAKAGLIGSFKAVGVSILRDLGRAGFKGLKAKLLPVFFAMFVQDFTGAGDCSQEMNRARDMFERAQDLAENLVSSTGPGNYNYASILAMSRVVNYERDGFSAMIRAYNSIPQLVRDTLGDDALQAKLRYWEQWESTYSMEYDYYLRNTWTEVFLATYGLPGVYESLTMPREWDISYAWNAVR